MALELLEPDELDPWDGTWTTTDTSRDPCHPDARCPYVRTEDGRRCCWARTHGMEDDQHHRARDDDEDDDDQPSGRATWPPVDVVGYALARIDHGGRRGWDASTDAETIRTEVLPSSAGGGAAWTYCYRVTAQGVRIDRTLDGPSILVTWGQLAARLRTSAAALF